MPSFTERYHELTKYRPETIDRLGGARWSEQPEPFKDVPEGRSIDLIPHLQALFKDAETPPDPLYPWLRDEILPPLTRLLHCTLGLTARLADAGASAGGGISDRDMFLRAAPSAGGLYPTEVYVAVRRYADLPAGLYHYHSRRSALIPVWEGDFFADLKHHFLGHPALAAANCVVLFTGLYARSAWRYRERAYRRILLDTGHAAANLLEMAEAMGLDAVPLASFLDDGLEELFFLGRKEEVPLLGVALGPGGTLGVSGGQRPGPRPELAVMRAEPEDPMMVQQNACERLSASDALRPPIPVPPAPDLFVATAPSPLAEARGDSADEPHDEPHEARHEDHVAESATGDSHHTFESFNAQTAILGRRSTRHFSGGSVLRRDLEDMLRFAFRALGAGHERGLLSRDALRLHLVAFSVAGLPAGVYEVDTDTLSLTSRREGDFRDDLHAISLGQDIASDCAFALVYTADMEALVSDYGDRGYRYACMDCGMIGERIQLWAGHCGLGSSGIGGYYDDLANELLGVPLSHGVLYLTVVGVPED